MPPGIRKNPRHHGTNFNQYSVVRGHDRAAPHLHNRAQTSNKAHDKFVPRRDCACADRSRPSLSTALLGGWSSHLVNRVSPHNPLVPSTLAWARRAYPSQARLGYAGAERSAPHLVPTKQTVPPLLPKATKPKCLTTANKERFLKPSRFSHDQQCS